MELAVNRLSSVIHQLEGMGTITVHVTVSVGRATVREEEADLMGGLWAQRDEIPEHVRILRMETHHECRHLGGGGGSLMLRELAKIFLKICVLQKSYFLWEFQAETLYVCPCFGHTYKVSAWNSHDKCYFWFVYFHEIILENSWNISETGPRAQFQ